jgi:hypothetical protein
MAGSGVSDVESYSSVSTALVITTGSTRNLYVEHNSD